MQKCFDEKDIQMLQEVISKMDPTVSYTVLSGWIFLDLGAFFFFLRNPC